MKKIKNIIVLYPSFERGGATANLINFVNACDKKKIKIYLITNITRKDQKKLFNNSIKIIKIDDRSNTNSFRRFYTSIFSSLKLIKLLKSIETKNSLVFSFQSHILPILITKLFGRKIIFRNSEDIIGATKYAENKLTAYLIFFLKLLFYNFSDGIITNSTKSKESLDKIIIKKKTKLIFNPYLKKIDKNKKIKKRKYILSVGRLCKQKNQKIIIKAFSIFTQKYPNYKLILIGHGPDKKILINFCKKLNIKRNIIFKGWIKNPKNYYLNSKVLIFPSLYEGLPNTLIDAINYNLPCISSRCSGAEDILTKKFGIFTPHDDPKFLAKKIEFVIKNYRNVNLNVLRIKKKLNRFLIQSQTSKYLSYCEDVLK